MASPDSGCPAGGGDREPGLRPPDTVPAADRIPRPVRFLRAVARSKFNLTQSMFFRIYLADFLQGYFPCSRESSFGSFLFMDHTMKKAACYIDGLNLYHRIRNNPGANINLASLARSLGQPDTEVLKICYFAAYAKWRRRDFRKHQAHVARPEASGVKCILSPFSSRNRDCTHCGRRQSIYEEKQTDVRMSLQILQDAEDDVFDVAFILSGDSDIVPAVQAVKNRHPNRKVLVVLPKGQARKAYDMTQTCDATVNLFRARIEEHLFQVLSSQVKGFMIFGGNDCPLQAIQRFDGQCKRSRGGFLTT